MHRTKQIVAMGLLSSLFGCKKPTNSSVPVPAQSHYQFEQPENTACFSCRHVIKEGAQILYVSHDSDDGGWQFLCGGDHTKDDAMIVGMGQIVKIDPSVNELHEMPGGVGATREKRGDVWKPFKEQ